MDGDVFVDGERPKPVTFYDMARYVVENGFFDGTPSDLIDLSPTGELTHVFHYYWTALHVKGHRVEVEENGKLLPLFDYADSHSG